LYQWALKLLLLKDQAMLDLKEGATELRGMIRIGASSVPGQFMIPKMVKKFRNQYPKATFHVNQSSSKIVAEKVLNGSVDFGLLGEKYENDKLCYIPLLKENLVLITSQQSNIVGPVDIETLLSYPFIMRNSDSGTNSLIERFLKKKQISKDQMNIVAYTENGQSLIQFVLQDIGIAIISEIAAREYYDKNLMMIHEINEFNEERYFYLVYNQNKTQSMLSKLFIERAPELIKPES
jgi:DNA-binding transcriptional LysR family regulator